MLESASGLALEHVETHVLVVGSYVGVAVGHAVHNFDDRFAYGFVDEQVAVHFCAAGSYVGVAGGHAVHVFKFGSA